VNFLGIDVRTLDLPSFLQMIRLVYLAAFLGWLVWLWKAKRWVGTTVPILLALFFWVETTYPLQRSYGLGPNLDRQRNLAWCATAAAGNRPWESGLYGKSHLEPFWATLVSTLALHDPVLVRAIYPFLPALAIILVGLSLRFCFGRDPDAVETSGEPALGPGAVLWVSFFVLVASSQPLDFIKAELGWPGKYFMLKPNHTTAFALVPIAMWLLSRPLTLRRSAFAVLVLAALGWAFVIFWVLLCSGILLHIAVGLAGRGSKKRPLRLAAILLTQMLLVAPNVVYLRSNFPHAVGLSAGKQLPSDPNRSPWLEAPPIDESLLFVATTRLGVVFYLGLYGMWIAWRSHDELRRLWLAVGVGAYLAWVGNIILYLTARARGATHLYMFLVLVMAVFAGLGAYDLVERGVRLFGSTVRPSLDKLASASRLGAASLLFLFPLTLPWWWQPDRMDGHFRVALDPVEPRLERLSDWILANTDGRDVFCAGREVLAWIPALTGRRALPPRRPASSTTVYPDECAAMVYSDRNEAVKVATRVGVSFLVSDPGLEADVPKAHFEDLPGLRKVFETGNLTVYRVLR
jgi:hypothetical protein